VVAASISAALLARGEHVVAFKPVVTGLDEPTDPVWPPDHELLARATGQAPAAVAPLRFGPAVSPHLAAELAGEVIEPDAIVSAALAQADAADAIVVEGVGGLLVPLASGYPVRDLAVALGLALIVVARPGLGTINHTLLTLEAARTAGLGVAGVVLTPWHDTPGRLEESNRRTIGELGAVAVATLRPLVDASRSTLAAAGAGLPLESWL